MTERFSQADVDAWARDGAVILPRFFSDEEMAPARTDFDTLYAADAPEGGEPVDLKVDGKVVMVEPAQFKRSHEMPFQCSPALNLLALHPALIAFARAALGTQDVLLYASQSWAKFTGDTDYDQPFHLDFLNHTLLVPGERPQDRTISFMIYATDVTEGHGAIRYAPKPQGDRICGTDRPAIPNPAQQDALHGIERSGVAPAGSIFAYATDVYHRGSNLTIPRARRYTLTASYKTAGNDRVGYTAWPRQAQASPWPLIFDNATPHQLACLGVPPPGDPFWTERTLARAQLRYPGWDLGAWRSALARTPRDRWSGGAALRQEGASS